MNFNFDNHFNKKIIGVDEVGRGPLAGPVVAAACHFTRSNNKIIKLKLFNDSKKLSKEKRERCFKHILELKKKSLIKFNIGISTVKEIDLYNILNATLLAMKRAIQKTYVNKSLILIDGNVKPTIRGRDCQTVIKGDQKSISIAAASIIAKIYRDNIMTKLSNNFPYYGWDKNMGYGTSQHKNAINLIGYSEQHRKSFNPVKNLIHKNK